MSTSEDRWQSEEYGRGWLAEHDRHGIEQEEQFDLIARLLPFAPEQEIEIADVGAGHGTLTAVLLEAFPRARAVCLDVNAAMIAAGTERLEPYAGRFRYVTVDMAAPGWPAEAPGPFDAVVSSRAIHHVPDERKRELFGEIFGRLRGGGWLLNFDYLRAPTDALRDTYIRVQGESDGPPTDHHQGHHSHTSPLLGQLAMLESVGFGDVDCFWKHLGRAIYGGRRL